MPNDDIFSAIRLGDSEAFSKLLVYDYNKLNEYNQNPLHEAISRKRSDFAFQLIQQGSNLDQQDYNGKVPLHYAAEHGTHDIALEMIRRGANVFLQDRYGNEPLWTATFNAKRNYVLVDALMQAGSNPDHKNRANKSPRELAIDCKEDNLVARLTR